MVLAMSISTIISFIHGRFAIALILFAVLLGLWGSFSLATRRQVSPSYRSAYLLMVGLTGLQGLVGIIAFAFGLRPREILHIVYGIFAFAFLPGVYVFAARGNKSREAMLLAVSCWVVAIAYGRGIMTGA